MNKIIYIVTLAVIAISCIQGKQTSVIDYNITTERLWKCDNSIVFYGNFFLDEKDSSIIKSEIKGGVVLKKIHYNSGVVRNIIIKGRGPNEYMGLNLSEIDSVGNLYATPYTLDAVIKLSNKGELLKTYPLNGRMFNVRRIGDYFISYGYAPDSFNMYILSDTNGVKITSFGNFPEDKISCESRYKTMAYQGTMLSNKNRVAFLSTMGKVFDIYEIKADSEPILISRICEDLPIYEPKAKVTGVKYNDFKLAYISAYSSDNYIYALYSGKKPKQRTFSADIEARSTNTIYVYDWDGNHKYNLKTDLPILSISVSKDDRFMIAIYNEAGEMRLCKFDLP